MNKTNLERLYRQPTALEHFVIGLSKLWQRLAGKRVKERWGSNEQ